jgi:hypothetical protein
MAFDVEGALAAGYSRSEIADYLASSKNFDIAGARNAGYSDEDILSHLLPEKPLAKAAAAPVKDTVQNPLKAKEPGLLDRLIDTAKSLTAPKPSSVMEGYTPTAEDQQKSADRRLALGQGPISEAAVAKAQDIRTGKLKTEDQGLIRVAQALEQQKAPTLEGVAQRVTEDERIAGELETARRRAVARENPLLGSLQSGLAGLTAGGLNLPSVAADSFNQTFVNPVLEAAGLQPLDRVPTAYGTEYLGKAAQDYMPAAGKQGMAEAYDKGQFGQWLFSNLAANSPQVAMSLAAAYFPPLRASVLPAMGATTAGQSFAGGDDSRVAMAKGAVEVVTEMLPLGVFDKVGDVLRGMSPPKQKAVLAVAGQRLLQTGADLTAVGLTNAVEEAAAQFGGNVLDRYFQGKDVELTQGLTDAAVLGAATGGAIAAPRGAMTLAGVNEPVTPEQEIAGIINRNVEGMQPVGTELQAVAALSPTPIDPAQLAQRILQAQSVDEAIAAADETAGTIPNFAMPAAPAAMTPLPAPAMPVAEIQQPAEPVMNMGRVEPTLEPVTEPAAVTLPAPDVAIEQQFGLDKLRLAPRPQRIQGQAVADLSDDQLRAVVEDEAVPAITRRGAQVELDARRSEQEPARVEPTIEPAATPAAAMPAAAAEPVAAAAEPATVREDAQRYFDEQATARKEVSPVQLNPAPEAEQQAVAQIAEALGSQFGTSVEAYSDPRDEAVNGFAYKGTAFVNVANVPMNVTRTTLHEFKHTVEQIAKAETEAGMTGTAAQQFVADIDSIFDDITEDGRRAYVENFLFKEELDKLTGAKREKRLRQLMASSTLRSEMTADFLGNRATDKAFWRDLAAQDPEGFKGFVEKWLKIIDDLLASLRGKKTQTQKESAKVDKYIRDLNTAKMIARDALIEYRRGALAEEAQRAAPGGKPAASLREGEVSETNVPTGGESVQPSAERAGPPAGEAGRGEVPSYGEAREGAISVVGRHYSPRVQTSLSSGYYGTGLRGAEGSRLRESKDSRISKRIYFYVDTGKGIRPESGVGRFAHEVRLDNIYDPSSRLIPPQGNANAFESAVIDAGFDGYIAPFGNGAAVVLLGPQHNAVPVKSLEQGPAFARRQKTTSIGDYETVPQKDGGIMVMGDAEEIRGLMPEGVVGRPVEGGVMFTPANAPRVRAALEGRKLAYSRAGAVVTKLPMKNGKYVGAPPKYDTPAKIATLRRNLRKLTKEGEAGRYWYENSSSEVLKMVGGDVQEARKFVALLSIYSPQAKVDANSTFALRAWAQYKAGLPISVKTGTQDAKARAALEDVDAFWSGEKTGNFFNNLLREIDPSTAGKQGATIDMWMMRAAEYPTDAPTSTQYAFMENETNAIARELGWEPQQVQAAIWVAMKARMENPGVKKRTEASSEKKGWIQYVYPLKNGKPTKTRDVLDVQKHRDNWLKHAFEHDPTKDDTAQAKFDFGDGLKRHIGQISFEARPGRTTNVLPGIHDAPYAQQVEFQLAVQAAFLDETGADRLAQLLGLLVDTNNILVPGVWQGEVSPSSQKLVAMAPAKGEEGKTAVDPAQAEALDLYAAVAGLVARQEGVGWHRPFFAGTKRDSNGLDIDLGRAINPAEAVDLERAVGVWMENNGKPNWQDEFAMISSPNGVRLVSFGVVSNETLHSDIVKVAESVLPDFNYRVFASSGNLVGNNWKENPNGESYVQRLSAAGRSDVLDWARTVLAPRVQSVFDEFSEKYGWGDPGQISFSKRQAEGGVREAARQVQEVTPELEDLFRGLNGRGLKRTRAQAAVSARPDAAQINYIQDNFLDILSELEDSGKVKINCD